MVVTLRHGALAIQGFGVLVGALVSSGCGGQTSGSAAHSEASTGGTVSDGAALESEGAGSSSSSSGSSTSGSTADCGGQTPMSSDIGSEAGGRDAGGDLAVMLPACAWPVSLMSLDHVDLSDGGCQAARVDLWCSESNGGNESCLSNDPTQCPGTQSPGPNCQSICRGDEYAVGCIGPGLGPWPQPPAACHAAPDVVLNAGVSIPPGNGATLYCCPCGC